MLELIIGIIIGATFSDFWRFIYVQSRNWIRKYMAKNPSD
jgi:hypothetical protein